jgi:hypothetical protein
MKHHLALLPAILLALLPKLACPACWPAYVGLLSVKYKCWTCATGLLPSVRTAMECAGFRL